MVDSPNAFAAIAGVGPGSDVQRVDTLYFKTDAPVLLQMTFDDGTGRAVGPVGGGIASIVAGTNGLAKVGTHSPHNLQAGDGVTLSGVQGTVEANGTWTIAGPTDAARPRDLPVTLLNAYTLGGVVAFNAIQATKPLSGFLLEEYPESNVLLALAVKGSARITFFACGLT